MDRPTTSAPSHPSAGSEARPEPLSRADKLDLVRRNREACDQDLLSGRLVFRSRPRIAEVQLSNICNMSCTMCYDGVNPPVKKLPAAVVERLATDVLPTASSLSPFVGSEPLIVTWDLTRDLARRCAVELNIVTNVQFLDEKTFAELEPFVSAVVFSVDSHLRDVYERIRLRSQPDKVFENLTRAARLCREHGIEPQANVVFMVENAPYLDETVGWLADQGCTTVRVLEFVPHGADITPRAFSDPRQHLSPEWIRWKREQMRAVAEQKGICLVLDGRDRAVYDHRPKGLTFRESERDRCSPWTELPYYLPGYCPQAVDHLKVMANGDAYPCCVVGGDSPLRLGNLERQEFDDVWNGPEARDLRRAMLTGDLPKACRGCHVQAGWWAPEMSAMPFESWFYQVHCGGQLPEVPEERRVLEVTGPLHHARTESSPTFSWRAPDVAIDHYLLVVSVAGVHDAGNRVFRVAGDATEFRIDDAEWRGFRPNRGHWWTIWGVAAGETAQSIRAPKIRSLVRHQPIPRVAGSRLYADG